MVTTLPPPQVAGEDRRSVSVPRGPALHGVAGGSSRPGHFGHHFVHPTCFDIAPVRRRRLPLQRSESSSASPTPPSQSSCSSSRTEQSRISTSPSTSLSTSPYSSSSMQHAVPQYSPSLSGAGTPSWSATSQSLALASFGKRGSLAPAPAQPVLRCGVDLTSHYRNYVRALNTRTFDLIARYVATPVNHNGVNMGPTEFFNLIPPGAVFMPEDIIVDFTNRTIAARLFVEYPCSTGSTTLWGVYPFANPEGEEEQRGRTEMRGTRRILQVDEMAFYRFDEEWRIESVNCMIASRNPIRSGSGSDDDYRERDRSGSM